MDELKKLQEQCKKLQEQNKKLQDELKKLQEQNKALKKFAAKQKVKEAISAKKIAPEQEAWAIDYALKDEDGFNEFVKNAKPIVSLPSDNQFSATNKPDNLDVVKIALGGENE